MFVGTFAIHNGVLYFAVALSLMVSIEWEKNRPFPPGSCSIITVVGAEMIRLLGVAGKVFCICPSAPRGQKGVGGSGIGRKGGLVG